MATSCIFNSDCDPNEDYFDLTKLTSYVNKYNYDTTYKIVIEYSGKLDEFADATEKCLVISDTIEKVEIIVNNDYDSSHLAFSDASDLFVINKQNIKDYFIQYPVAQHYGVTYFSLIKYPAIKDSFSFTFKYYLKGEGLNYLEKTTEKFPILKTE